MTTHLSLRLALRTGFACAGVLLFGAGLLHAQSVATTTQLEVTPAAPRFGEAVTLTATVDAAKASGSMAFVADGVLVGVGQVVNGTAQTTTLTLPAGLHTLQAVYGGDAGARGHGYAPSTSAPVTVVVTAMSGAGFAPPVHYPAGIEPYAVTAGDFNGDGRADLAIANPANLAVTILVGTGGGTFQGPFQYAAGNAPFAVVTADFNGDGRSDLAVANVSSNAVSVLLGNGDASFQAPVTSTAGPVPYAIAAGDFNRDGHADLAVANSSRAGDAVGVLFGTGTGTFQPPVLYPAEIEPVAVAVGDFNLDGTADIAAANYGSRSVSVLVGKADGTFQPAVHYPTGSAYYASPYSVALGDFNGDGRPDLAVANYKTADVSVLIGNGDGTFRTAVEYAAGIGPRSVAVSDFNGDGRVDLAVVNTTSTPGNVGPWLATVSVLRGQGDGSFQPPIAYATGTGPLALAVADFNGDARADIATVNEASADVSVLLATAPPTTAVSLSAGPSPSTYGQSVTLTADVTPAAATGQVEFLDGTTVLGAAPVDATGRAEIRTILLSSGTRALRAIYTGVPGVWQPSRSATVSHMVIPVAAAGFAPAVTYPTAWVGSSSFSNAAGDFNEDGKADLAVANYDPGTVSVLLGNGNGTLQAAVEYTTGPGPLAVAVGDFNADRAADLLLLVVNGALSVLFGNGDGSFQTPLYYPMASLPRSLGVGDFNEDGKADVAVTNHNSNTVTVLLGNGDGTFQTAGNYAIEARSLSVTVDDFNGDGKADLAVAIYGFPAGSVNVLLGNGNGTFQPPVSYATPRGAQSVAATDLDVDGKVDLAVGTTDGIVSVLAGNGDGTFQQVVNYTAVTGSTSIAVGDLNGDGMPDVAATKPWGVPGVSVLLGTTLRNGAWTLATPLVYDVESAPSVITTADLNGDGRADLAVSLASSPPQGVSILLGTAAASTSISLSTAPNPSTYGQMVTLTATVSPPEASGYVEFLDGTTVLGTAPIGRHGQAILGTNLLPAGTRALRAIYPGRTDTWLPSQSAVVNHVVNAVVANSFSAPVNYAAGSEANSVAVGDFNNDRRADLAVANIGSGSVSVLLGNANGTFQAAVNYAAGNHPFAVVVGDFNRDGKADLAVANISSNTVSVLLGNGNGTFQAPLTSAAGTTPRALAAGDFNVDGKTDLVVANSTVNAVSVLLGDGTGTFQPPLTSSVGIEPVAVAVGDFNGDGAPDVATANYVTRNASVLLGNGNGTLQAAVHYATGSADYAAPFSVAVGDFNGDAKADLAVANYKTASVSVLLGNGDGTFQVAVDYGAGLGPRSVAVGDFNGDGIADLAVANTSSTPGNETPATFLSIVSVLLGNGNGSFRAPIQYSAGTGPVSVAVGEFNNDGRADLAVANSAGNNVSVLLATRVRGRVF